MIEFRVHAPAPKSAEYRDGVIAYLWRVAWIEHIQPLAQTGRRLTIRGTVEDIPDPAKPLTQIVLTVEVQDASY